MSEPSDSVNSNVVPTTRQPPLRVRIASMIRRLPWWRYFLPAAVSGFLSAVLYWHVHRTDGRIGTLLGARTDQLRAVVICESENPCPKLVRALRLDTALAFTTTITIVLVVAFWTGHRHTRRSRARSIVLRLVVAIAAVLYLVFDLEENRRLGRIGSVFAASAGNAARTAATNPAIEMARRRLAHATDLKWGCLIPALLLSLLHLGRRLPITTLPSANDESSSKLGPPPRQWSKAERPCFGGSGTVPDDADWTPTRTRMGVAVSGGGIRSASFALGVLQVLREKGLIERSRYIASVSGGSYITGAITISNRANEPGGDPPFAPATAEEQKLRRNLDYLVSKKTVTSAAVARLLTGLLINLMLLLGLTFVVVRPIGWLIGTDFFHPELRLTTPVVTGLHQLPKFCDSGVVPPLQPHVKPCTVLFGQVVTISSAPADGTLSSLSTDPAHPIEFCVNGELGRSGPRVQTLMRLETSQSGIVRSLNSKTEVLRQPRLRIAATTPQNCDRRNDHERLPSDTNAARLRDQLSISRQPTISLVTASAIVSGEVLEPNQIRLDTPPSVKAESAMAQHPKINMNPQWKWRVPLGVLLFGGLLFLYRITIRPKLWKWVDRVAWVTVIAGALMLVLWAVLPWLADAYPRRLASGLTSSPTGNAKLPLLPRLPGGVFASILLAVSTLRKYVRRSPASASKPRAIKENAKALRSKLMGIVQRAFVGVVLGALLLVNFMNVLVLGAANGPSGHLAWLTHDLFGFELRFPPDLVFWCLLTATLIVLATAFEATSWSLAPVYKRRLFSAFGLQRIGRQAGMLELSEAKEHWEYIRAGPAPGGESPTRSERAGFFDGEEGDGTELVLCCAANIVGADRAPTGRRAVSFSVSRSVVGGPEVGWVAGDTYLARMGRRRLWDINVPAIVGVSGAAVSPAMGRQSLGPIGSVLAMLNVRLGAWLPHPQWVGNMDVKRTPTWTHVPGWPWFLREVVRRYRSEAPYLYVTDGGHWENLGLVEILRRGCGHVICISAAGDGAHSMATLGEAIEIARSDLHIEIELDPWAMRPQVGQEPRATLPSGRQFLSQTALGISLGVVADKGYATGTIIYPNGTIGSLLYIDAVMVDALPVDVHAYAEKHPEFPNVSTGDQLFDNSDFEAYRSLGRHLASSALASKDGVAFTYRAMRDTAALGRKDPKNPNDRKDP